MNRAQYLMLLGTCLSLCYSASGQQRVEPGSQQAFDTLISEIAEKPDRQAEDYQQIAQHTHAIGQQAQQSGQSIPHSAVFDALDAVAAGRQLDPDAADWDTLQSELERLLEPPEQQEDEQQEDEQQEQQDGEQKEEGSGEQDGSNSDVSEQEDGSEGEPSDQQQEGQNGQEPNGQDSEEQSESSEGSEGDQEQQAREDGAKVGELQGSDQPVELDEEAPGEPEEMQNLGGQKNQGEPLDAKNAAVRQMLEQLKQQDDPAKLFQLLQEAQTGERRKQQPNERDW